VAARLNLPLVLDSPTLAKAARLNQGEDDSSLASTWKCFMVGCYVIKTKVHISYNYEVYDVWGMVHWYDRLGELCIKM